MFQLIIDENTCQSIIDTNNCNNWVTWNSKKWKQKSIEKKTITKRYQSERTELTVLTVQYFLFARRNSCCSKCSGVIFCQIIQSIACSTKKPLQNIGCREQEATVKIFRFIPLFLPLLQNFFSEITLYYYRSLVFFVIFIFFNLLHCKISVKLSSFSFPSRIFTIPVSKCLFFTIRAFFPRYLFSGSSFGNFLAVSSAKFWAFLLTMP